MKIPQNKNKLIKISIITAAIIIIIIACVFVYVNKFNGSIFGWTNTKSITSGVKSSTNLDKPTDAQIKAGNDAKQNAVDPTKPGTSGSDTPPPVTPPESGSTKSTVAVQISAAAQNGSVFQLHALIDAVENTGTCTLTLIKGSFSVVKTAGVQALSTTSTCQGFDIPISELGPGDWQAALVYSSDTVNGSASKTITIQ